MPTNEVADETDELLAALAKQFAPIELEPAEGSSGEEAIAEDSESPAEQSAEGGGLLATITKKVTGSDE